MIVALPGLFSYLFCLPFELFPFIKFCCPGNNFKIIKETLLKLHQIIKDIKRKNSNHNSLLYLKGSITSKLFRGFCLNFI